MLPYLQPKRIVAVMMARRKPDGAIEQEGLKGEPKDALMNAAEDLIRAVHAKDAKAVADALQAAFMECDKEPHEEGPHLEPPGEDE